MSYFSLLKRSAAVAATGFTVSAATFSGREPNKLTQTLFTGGLLMMALGGLGGIAALSGLLLYPDTKTKK